MFGKRIPAGWAIGTIATLVLAVGVVVFEKAWDYFKWSEDVFSDDPGAFGHMLGSIAKVVAEEAHVVVLVLSCVACGLMFRAMKRATADNSEGSVQGSADRADQDATGPQSSESTTGVLRTFLGELLARCTRLLETVPNSQNDPRYSDWFQEAHRVTAAVLGEVARLPQDIQSVVRAPSKTSTRELPGLVRQAFNSPLDSLAGLETGLLEALDGLGHSDKNGALAAAAEAINLHLLRVDELLEVGRLGYDSVQRWGAALAKAANKRLMPDAQKRILRAVDVRKAPRNVEYESNYDKLKRAKRRVERVRNSLTEDDVR